VVRAEVVYSDAPVINTDEFEYTVTGPIEVNVISPSHPTVPDVRLNVVTVGTAVVVVVVVAHGPWLVTVSVPDVITILFNVAHTVVFESL
jgi:hypothetical protein